MAGPDADPVAVLVRGISGRTGSDGLAGECFEELGELCAFAGVRGPERLAGPALHPTADAFDDGTSVAGEVDEDAPAINGVGAPVGELCGDQAVDDAGGRGGWQGGVRGDLAHAPATPARQHQQHAPTVTAHPLGRCDRRERGGDGAIQPVE